MYGVVDKPRMDVKSSAPVFGKISNLNSIRFTHMSVRMYYFYHQEIIDIPTTKRSNVIGLGGATIKGLQEEYGLFQIYH